MTMFEAPFTTRINTVKDVKARIFIERYAQYLKSSDKIKYPKWADYVKTGIGKELAPQDPDWFFVRSAAIARKLFLRPDVGVGRLRKSFSCKKRRGVAPEITTKGSGKIIRNILQQFEEKKLVEQEDGGRRLTDAGYRDLNAVARQCEAVVA